MKALQNLTLALVLTLSSLGAVGCGRAPLTEAQKQIVRETTQSATRATGAPSKAHEGHKPTKRTQSEALSLTSILMLDRADASSIQPSDDQNAELMEQRLLEAFKKGECTYSAAGSNSAGDLPATPISISGALKVTGTRCPIALDIGFTSSGSSSASVEMGITLAYEVKEESFRKFNDIDQFDLKGTMKVEGSSSSANVKAEIKGQMHSQKRGKIQVALKQELSMLSQTSVKIDASVILTYSDFEAEIRAEGEFNFASAGSGSNKLRYTLNGVEMTEAELKKFLSDLQ